MLHYNSRPSRSGNGPHGRAEPPRSRPRQAGLAGDPSDAAGLRRTSRTPSAWCPEIFESNGSSVHGHGLRLVAGLMDAACP
jgi:hypothetical protein